MNQFYAAQQGLTEDNFLPVPILQKSCMHNDNSNNAISCQDKLANNHNFARPHDGSLGEAMPHSKDGTNIRFMFGYSNVFPLIIRKSAAV